jgi:hypothetical protein
MLALSALAGSAMIASAATAPDTGTNYELYATFTNSPTCAVPKLVSVYGLPYASGDLTFVIGNYTVVNTDGKGTIDGTSDLIVSNPTPAFVHGFGMYGVDISGSVTTVKTNASVKMTMKGTGYVEAPDHTSQKASTLNLTFASDANGITSATNLAGPFTNDVNVVHVNADGTTNYTSTTVVPSKFIRTPYQSVTIAYHYSQTTTNVVGGVTNIHVHDVITESDPINFAAATATNVWGTINNVLGDNAGTNVYNIVSIQSRTTASNTNTDLARGLDIGSVAGYISSFSVSNAGLVQVVMSVTTNDVDSGVTILGGSVTLSNSYQIMSGTLKGSITATGVKAAQINTPARFVTDSTLYTTFAPYQTYSNYIYSVTNVVGGVTNIVSVTNTTTFLAAVYALDQGGLNVNNKNELDARVIQTNSKFVTSGSDDAFNGSGTLTTKSVKSTATKPGSTNTTYKATLNGRAWNRGSTLTLSGTNGFHIINITYSSNNTPVVVSVTNHAVLPYPPGLSFTLTNTSGQGYFTNPVVTYPSTTNAGVVTTVVSDFGGIDVPAYNNTLTTNAAPLGIKSVTLSGKLQGQTIAAPSKTVIGVNGFNLDYFSY